MAITVNLSAVEGSVKNRAFFALSAADVSVDLPAVITFNPGFVPKKVVVTKPDVAISHIWQYGMAVGSYIEELQAGDKTLETDALLSVNATTGVISITQASNPTVDDNDLFVVEVIG